MNKKDIAVWATFFGVAATVATGMVVSTVVYVRNMKQDHKNLLRHADYLEECIKTEMQRVEKEKVLTDYYEKQLKGETAEEESTN